MSHAVSCGFLSTPSARRATKHIRIHRRRSKHFYPRPPRGGRRYAIVNILLCFFISIHALREEGDRPSRPARRTRTTYFYPRPPRGGRRGAGWISLDYVTFLSTPSARRATLQVRQDLRRVGISIHALREEGDRLSDAQLARLYKFLSTPSARRATPFAGLFREHSLISIHALREEGDGSV